MMLTHMPKHDAPHACEVPMPPQYARTDGRTDVEPSIPCARSFRYVTRARAYGDFDDLRSRFRSNADPVQLLDEQEQPAIVDEVGA